MERYHLSITHRWADQQIKVDDATFLHRQCQICGRDFAKSVGDGEWRAIHLGALKFDFLNEQTTQQWVSQDCPGQRLQGESNGERMAMQPRSRQDEAKRLSKWPRR